VVIVGSRFSVIAAAPEHLDFGATAREGGCTTWNDRPRLPGNSRIGPEKRLELDLDLKYTRPENQPAARQANLALRAQTLSDETSLGCVADGGKFLEAAASDSAMSIVGPLPGRTRSSVALVALSACNACSIHLQGAIAQYFFFRTVCKVPPGQLAGQIQT